MWRASADGLAISSATSRASPVQYRVWSPLAKVRLGRAATVNRRPQGCCWRLRRPAFAWQLHTEHDASTPSWPGATVTNGGYGSTHFDDIFMTPDDHGHWQRASADEQGREVPFHVGNSRPRAGWVSKSLAGTLYAAVTEEGLWTVLRGDLGRLEPRMELAPE